MLCGLAILAGCAGPPRSRAAIVAGPTATPNGALVTGTIVAVRPVDAEAAASPGTAQVLAALQIAAPTTPPNATEFVIQRNDGNVASIVLSTPKSSPTASLSAANFSLGDHVDLLTGAATELIHHEP